MLQRTSRGVCGRGAKARAFLRNKRWSTRKWGRGLSGFPQHRRDRNMKNSALRAEFFMLGFRVTLSA